MTSFSALGAFLHLPLKFYHSEDIFNNRYNSHIDSIGDCLLDTSCQASYLGEQSERFFDLSAG
jgi:hypothetical protein